MENYAETIIIPFLRKKVADLQAAMLVLEASLLIEQGKNREISLEITEKEKTISELKNASSESSSSVKKEASDAISRLNQINEINSTLVKRIEDLKRTIVGQEASIAQLEEENRKLKEDLETSAASKRKKNKETVLDGSTF